MVDTNEDGMFRTVSMKHGGKSRRARLVASFAVAFLLSTAAACSSPEQKVAKYTASGMEYLEEGDIGRANVQFQNALKIDEEYVPALTGLVEIMEKRQDFGAMFGTLQRIVRLEPDNVDALVKLGKLYLIGSDETAALETVEKALALAPQDAGALALKGAVLLKLGDETKAVELARNALEIDPGNTEAVAVIAAERASARDNEGALAEVERALEVNNSASILHLLRLQLLANLGREDELRSGFEKLIEIEPETVSYRQMYANALIRQNEFDEARQQLEEVARLQPDKVEPVLDVVRIDYRVGGKESAIKTFKKYIDARPDNKELKFTFGHYLRQEGDLAGAEAIYSALAANKADTATYLRARNDIAGIRVVQGKRDEAREIVDEILAEDSANPDALVKRAGLKIDDKEYDSAIADLRTVFSSKPDMAAAKLLMASAFEGKGDVEYATSQYAQAVADSGKAADSSRIFARFLMRQKNNERAEQVLLESLAAHPRDVENLKMLAALRLARQDWRGAEEAAKLIEQVDEEEPTINRILGVARTGLEDYSGAIDALTAANKETPLAARPLATLVSAFVKDGRPGEAESLLVDMINADAGNYAARLLLAQVLKADNRFDEMEATLKAAIENTPERADAVETLYRYYLSVNRFDEAEQMIDAAIAAAPENDGLKVLRADLLITTDRRREAIDIYADILTRRPSDMLVSNNYASLILETRNDKQSLAKALDVARALEGSENPYFLDTLGWAHYRNGAAAQAAPVLEKTVEIAPNFAEAQYHLGAAYLAAGEEEKGRATLEKALSLDSTASWADEARDLLVQD